MLCFIEKPGVCPVQTHGKVLCHSNCGVDTDCPGSLKCCSVDCGTSTRHNCLPPQGINDDNVNTNDNNDDGDDNNVHDDDDDDDDDNNYNDFYNPFI